LTPEAANNPQDLCERLGLNRQHRFADAQRKGVTHSSSPVGRRGSQHRSLTGTDAKSSVAAAPRPQSGSRNWRHMTLDPRAEAEGRPRGSSLGRAMAMQPPSQQHTERDGARLARQTISGETKVSQKYRPIGSHNRLRAHITQSRQYNAGLVLSRENDSSAGPEQAAGQRALSYSPIVHAGKTIADSAAGGAGAVAGRPVPYRPRSANSTAVRGIARKIL
jgi:hypothetical protein